MKKVLFLSGLLMLLSVGGLSAQMPSLTYGEDYTVSDEVYSVTTVKVSPNRIDPLSRSVRSR